MILVGIAQRRRPRQVLVHICQNRRNLRERFYAGIPGLFVYFLGKRISFQAGMRLHPSLRFDNLGWIGRGCEDLRDQRVRVQRNRRDELVQFLRLLGSRRGVRRRYSGHTLIRSGRALIRLGAPCLREADHNGAAEQQCKPLFRSRLAKLDGLSAFHWWLSCHEPHRPSREWSSRGRACNS